MLTRAVVGVYTGQAAKDKKADTVVMPQVFSTAIRPDLVQETFKNVNKNKRQAYAVSRYAGHQTSAESWGTGRAVARIPRVAGGGTSRAGQGAFGNMCRGGRMFAPTKTWRRWTRKTNLTQRRHAVASAISATAIPAFVQSRGHKVDRVNEIPLVIDTKVINNLEKTKQAVALLKAVGADQDVNKVKETKSLRPGKGKWRNRRWRTRRGPLVVYNEKTTLVKAFRGIQGVDLCSVDSLSLLQLAPGGHLGRFVIWTKDAFQKLDSIFGTFNRSSTQKKGYKLPRAMMTNPDVSRLINSEEIQSNLNPKKSAPRVHKKVNPLNKPLIMQQLDPSFMQRRRTQILSKISADKTKAEALAKGVKPQQSATEKKRLSAKKSINKKNRPANRKFVTGLLAK